MVQNAQRGVQRHNTRSHACSSAKSAVPNACVSLQELMATSKSALVIITGRPKEEDPSALEPFNFSISIFYYNYKKKKKKSVITLFYVCLCVTFWFI